MARIVIKDTVITTVIIIIVIIMLQMFVYEFWGATPYVALRGISGCSYWPMAIHLLGIFGS